MSRVFPVDFCYIATLCFSYSYYPVASQPPKIDVRFSALKTWSGSGQNPRQWRVRIWFCHTRFLIEWNAHDVRITRGNTSSYSNRRFCVEKRLTKPRVCGIIFPASERGSQRSIFLFRGIAQLVEQRSPNVNRDFISPIITGFLRLGTSVSSLFSCFDFCKSLKWFMQIRVQNRQKISEQHQKTSNFSLGRKRMFFVSENDWMMLFRVSQTQISWLSRPSKNNLLYPSS